MSFAKFKNLLSGSSVFKGQDAINEYINGILDNNLTLEKLALGLMAVMKNDKNYLNLNQVGKGKDVIRKRLKGIYEKYRKFLKEKGFTSIAGSNLKEVLGNANIDKYYFPFLKLATNLAINKGNEVKDYEDGFGNSVIDKKVELSDRNYVELSGLVWVGNKLQAVTGNNNNLYFSGAVIVGRGDDGDKYGMHIRGVKNVTLANEINPFFGVRIKNVLY